MRVSAIGRFLVIYLKKCRISEEQRPDNGKQLYLYLSDQYVAFNIEGADRPGLAWAPPDVHTLSAIKAWSKLGSEHWSVKSGPMTRQTRTGNPGLVQTSSNCPSASANSAHGAHSWEPAEAYFFVKHFNNYYKYLTEICSYIHSKTKPYLCLNFNRSLKPLRALCYARSICAQVKPGISYLGIVLNEIFTWIPHSW